MAWTNWFTKKAGGYDFQTSAAPAYVTVTTGGTGVNAGDLVWLDNEGTASGAWNTTSSTWTAIPMPPEGYAIPRSMAQRLNLPDRCPCTTELCWAMDKNHRGQEHGRWFFVSEHLDPGGIVCPHREEDAYRNQFDMAAAQCEMLLDIS